MSVRMKSVNMFIRTNMTKYVLENIFSVHNIIKIEKKVTILLRLLKKIFKFAEKNIRVRMSEIPTITKKKGVFMEEKRDLEIVFSKAVKAGKRIYYFDVKKNRSGEYYLAITESKKRVSAENDSVSFEKHKIFLYKEDFTKFADGLNEVTMVINEMNSNREDI